MRYGLHFFNFKVSLFILIIIIVGFHMNVMGDVLSKVLLWKFKPTLRFRYDVSRGKMELSGRSRSQREEAY